MAGRRPGGAFGGGWANGVSGFPWAGEAPAAAISAQPRPASPPPVTPPATAAASSSAKLSPPAQSTNLPSSRPPASVPSAGGTNNVSFKPSGTSPNAHGTEDGTASGSVDISFTSLDGQTIQVVTTVTTSSSASNSSAAANTPTPHSSNHSGIVAVATISTLLLTGLVVALAIFLLRRRERRSRAVRSSFIHVPADSDPNSDVAPTIRAFSKERPISRPRSVPLTNRDSNVLDEENARLREAVARLQDRLEDLGHADDPSLPAYDSHSAASRDSHP